MMGAETLYYCGGENCRVAQPLSAFGTGRTGRRKTLCRGCDPKPLAEAACACGRRSDRRRSLPLDTCAGCGEIPVLWKRCTGCGKWKSQKDFHCNKVNGRLLLRAACKRCRLFKLSVAYAAKRERCPAWVESERLRRQLAWPKVREKTLASWRARYYTDAELGRADRRLKRRARAESRGGPQR